MTFPEAVELFYSNFFIHLHTHSSLDIQPYGLSLQEWIEDIIKEVFNQTFKPLSKAYQKLVEWTFDQFKKASEQGYGLKLSEIEYGTPDYTTLERLQDNLLVFAAHKQTNLIKDLTYLLRDGDTIRPWVDFKTKALALHQNYNVRWLQAEYNTSIAQAQNARQWVEIESESDLFPYLRYSAVGDANTRPSHNALSGVIKKWDDSFWDTFYPPIDWQCRCEALQEKSDKGGLQEPDLPLVHPVFSHNVGKTGEIFNENHPYFERKLDKANKEAIITLINKVWLNKNPSFSDSVKAVLKRNLQGKYPDLSTEEMASLHFYTTHQYQRINQKNRFGSLSVFQKRFMQTFNIAYEKLEKQSGIFYRFDATNIPNNHLIAIEKLFKEGKPYQDKGIFSMTDSLKSFQEIKQRLSASAFKADIEIRAKSARKISDFSQKPDQNEVILKNNSKFTILKLERTGNEFSIILEEA